MASLSLVPGRIYRTREFAAWSRNASRLIRQLAARGQLRELAHGIYLHPRIGRFGETQPDDDALMRAFLDGAPFVFTGPARWNPLGLGTTAVFASPLVYNGKRSGTFTLGNRRFVLRRVAFPDSPPAEWFVVDLFEHAAQAGTTRELLAMALRQRLSEGRFDRTRLRAMAERYGSRRTREAIVTAIAGAPA